MRLALLALTAGLLAASAVASGRSASALSVPRAAPATPSISEVTLRDFVLRPSGLLFSFHPTEARILVTTVADGRLRVCEGGTTFSHYWRGGCRTLGPQPLALPTSGGAVHVAFRVMPSRAAATRVTMLRVRWHCVDHDFVIERGATRVARASPTFDC